MNIEVFREYCMAKKGVTEEFPFDEDTLVFKVMGKMFALSSLKRLPAQANLKCDPDRALELREEYDGTIIPGYHMSKIHWNTLLLERVPPKLTIELIDHSYDLVVAKFTKKLKQALDSFE
ncbi:MmcQ/YjbR family DNA-binding protein [Cellulophaga sp. HaHa_2_95]|uniref:MmcQ/YjbR family DNA-binding protein n=1 Tax=unclassified Cellulophaga TaxID=2634405 RepID=UPI001C4F8EF8|nr:MULTISPECIES: MmcQ/YjbR family DNA-binding protein [unclassified Cellulophaga]QXP51507.1 MmcQ/YjbR family DNA-binding protein [Cellulophaga sp. HaHa_2_1]QXP56166.1 MmcQ/YjbR family DNA-binding protein [Cellulophaga sp. HaHa_2_95]